MITTDGAKKKKEEVQSSSNVRMYAFTWICKQRHTYVCNNIYCHTHTSIVETMPLWRCAQCINMYDRLEFVVRSLSSYSDDDEGREALFREAFLVYNNKGIVHAHAARINYPADFVSRFSRACVILNTRKKIHMFYPLSPLPPYPPLFPRKRQVN